MKEAQATKMQSQSAKGSRERGRKAHTLRPNGLWMQPWRERTVSSSGSSSAAIREQSCNHSKLCEQGWAARTLVNERRLTATCMRFSCCL